MEASSRNTDRRERLSREVQGEEQTPLRSRGVGEASLQLDPSSLSPPLALGEEGSLENLCLLLCIHTLKTPLLIPTSLQHSSTTPSSLCILQPSPSHTSLILRFCSGLNFVRILFFCNPSWVSSGGDGERLRRWKLRWQPQAAQDRAETSEGEGANSPQPSRARSPSAAAWFLRHAPYATSCRDGRGVVFFGAPLLLRVQGRTLTSSSAAVSIRC